MSLLIGCQKLGDTEGRIITAHTISDSWQAFPSYESDSYKKLLSRYLVALSDFQNLDLEQSNSGIALFNSVILVTHVIITCKETLTLTREVN